ELARRRTVQRKPLEADSGSVSGFRRIFGRARFATRDPRLDRARASTAPAGLEAPRGSPMLQETLASKLELTKTKALLVCSNGGHLLQLLPLRDLFDPETREWVTFEKEDAKSLLRGEKVRWAHHPTNRNVPNLVRNLFLARRVLREVRPNLVISTGAGVAVPFIWLAKRYGARSVFIESFTRIHNPSLTGKLVRNLADLVIYQ